jgi:cell wall-associated NlpC family hydrolase
MIRSIFRAVGTAMALGALGACATAFAPSIESWDGLTPDGRRERIVADAEAFARHRDFRVEHRAFSRDCSGYVGAVLLASGIDVFRGASELQIRGNGVRILSEFVAKYGTLSDAEVRPGDLVFFSNTYDRNGDRKLNDPLTHVGIVERVGEDGTVFFLHHMKGKVRRYSMNLSDPGRAEDDSGKVLNSYLRKRRRSDPRGTRYLAGELFAGYGSLVTDPLTAASPSPTSADAPEPKEAP